MRQIFSAVAIQLNEIYTVENLSLSKISIRVASRFYCLLLIMIMVFKTFHVLIRCDVQLHTLIYQCKILTET